MNKLSFGTKFSLISVLFFVPMLVTNYYLVRDSFTQYQATKTESESLGLLGETLELRRAVEDYENLAVVQFMVGQANESTELQERVKALEASVIKSVEALDANMLPPAQLKEFNIQKNVLLEGLRSAQNTDAPAKKQAEATKQVANTQLLILSLVSGSGLGLDSYREIRQLIELVSKEGAEVTELLSNGRAIGAYSLGRGILNSADVGKLENILQSIDQTYTQYGMSIDGILGSNPALRSAVETQASASRESLKAASKMFDEQLLMAGSYDAPWKAFYEQATGEIAKTYTFGDAVLGYLDGQLDQRLADNKRNMVLLVVALLVVFLLIVYLYSGFYVAIRSTLKSFSLVMDEVANGNMTVSVPKQSQDELGDLGQVFNGTITKVHHLIQRVGQTVSEVERQADRVEMVSGESSQAVSSQRSQIEQVATAMNEMSATAQEVARSAAGAVTSANSVNKETLNGRSLVESQVGSIQRLAEEIEQSVSVINQLASDSASISQVLDVIKGIAEQTNLLALNAAIEAARAGEQGRGFAVVADEVRNLAKRTQQSTEEIEQMISRLQNGVGAAVKAMNTSHQMADNTVSQSGQVQQALENILGAVGMIVDQNQQIAAAAEEQTAVAHDIDQNIVQINQAGERTAEGASQTEQASRELSELVERLKSLIGAFRV
jgi:methyl-accepting chemotaxis protein